MSHISEMKMTGDVTAVDDLDAIEWMATLMGGKFVKGQTTYKWYGSIVGDTPPPAWLERPGVCDHAISFPGIGYEVGVCKVGGEYRFVYDDYDGRLKAKIGGSDGAALARNYADAKKQLDAIRTIERAAANRGLKARRLVTSGSNTIRLEVDGYR